MKKSFGYFLLINSGGLVLVSVLLMAAISYAVDNLSPPLLLKDIDRTTQSDQQMQQKAAQWEEEKQLLISDLQESNSQSRWLDHQIKKYQIYIQKQLASIDALEQKRAEVLEINQSLEPFLEEIYQRLAAFIEQDLDFLAQERQKRLQFLRDSLDDYHIGLSEKCRRMMEALQVEAEYGRTVEVKDAVLDIEGQPVAVRIFRLGRVTLFYQSLDGKKVGRFHADTGQWDAIDERFAAIISQAVEMAERRRVIDLLDLPIGAWKK
jgi:hypothetical protein